MMLLSARTVSLGVHHDDGKVVSCNGPKIVPSSDESFNRAEEDPSDSPRRFSCSSPRCGLSRSKVDVLRA